MDPVALEVRLKPQKSGFLPKLSPPGVLGQVGRVAPFWNRDNKAKKTLGAEFLALAHSRRKWGQPKFWNFDIFYYTVVIFIKNAQKVNFIQIYVPQLAPSNIYAR